MLSGGARVRRALAAARARPRILHRNYSKNERVHTPSLTYAVRRRDPELVCPAAPTPRETKSLSDLDIMISGNLSLALFYRGREDGVDPAGVIRRALGEALVHYYPMAGRLREIEGRKLAVDCTGEGVLFVQADADVELEDLEAGGLKPPFPCWHQLLFDVQGSSGMLNCPLLLIQVTRLLCGGFAFALRFNHSFCDGIGIVQFMNAVAEHARGLPATTVVPVWSRELLDARCQPMPSTSDPHPELDLPPPPASDDMVMRSFTFGASDVAAITKSLPLPLRDTATAFEALAAFLWRARTAALEVPAGEDAALVIVANLRGAAKMSLPAGYYGNAIVTSTVLVDAAALRGGSLGDAVALVQRAKAAVDTEYARSFVDEMTLRGRRWIWPANMFFLSDARRLGFDQVDFGWGEPAFAGPADKVFGVSYLIPVKDRDGVDAVAVPVVLPRLAMDRFAAEVEELPLMLNPAGHASVILATDEV